MENNQWNGRVEPSLGDAEDTSEIEAEEHAQALARASQGGEALQDSRLAGLATAQQGDGGLPLAGAAQGGQARQEQLEGGESGDESFVGGTGQDAAHIGAPASAGLETQDGAGPTQQPLTVEELDIALAGQHNLGEQEQQVGDQNAQQSLAARAQAVIQSGRIFANEALLLRQQVQEHLDHLANVGNNDQQLLAQANQTQHVLQHEMHRRDLNMAGTPNFVNQPSPRSGTDTGAGPESGDPGTGLRRSWKRINAGGKWPSPRSGAASVVIQVDGTSFLYVLGGYGGESRLGDFFKFNFSTREWSRIENLDPCPGPRENNGFVSVGHCLILMGGYDGDTWLSDLWEFNTLTERWRLVDAKGEVPSPRFGFVSVTHSNKMVLFGGYSGTAWLNDMYELDLTTERWTLLTDVTGELPSKRSCPSWSLFGDSIIMFGGYDGVHRKNDLFEYNLLERHWSEITCERGSRPSGRYFHACGVYGNSFVVFGGYNGRERLNDLHRFSFETKSWSVIKAEGEVPSGRSSLVAQIHDNALVVFGGYNGTHVLNDFFEYPFMCVHVPPPQLKRDLAALVDHQVFSDVTFIVEGRPIKAVRALLAIRSEHFRALLFGGMRESKSFHSRWDSDGASAAGGSGHVHGAGGSDGGGDDDSIVLHDMQYDVFMAVLEFLYTDSATIPADLAVPLLIASERYLLPRLKSLCEETILRGICLDNAVHVLLQSYLHNASSLKTICLDFIVDNIVLLRTKPQFQALKQEPDLLMDIIMRSTAMHPCTPDSELGNVGQEVPGIVQNPAVRVVSGATQHAPQTATPQQPPPPPPAAAATTVQTLVD